MFINSTAQLAMDWMCGVETPIHCLTTNGKAHRLYRDGIIPQDNPLGFRKWPLGRR